MELNNLKITNVVVTGRIPLRSRLDYNKIVKNSKWIWEVNNEDYSPICSTRIIKNKKDLNVHKKPKSAYVSIWHSGAINIVGVTSLKEAIGIYDLVIKELLEVGAVKLKHEK